MVSESSGQPGRLVIISGPSGVGKSTVVRQLIATCDLPLELSVSATTRPPRSGEVDGVNYLFLSHDQFQQRVQAGDFLEYVEVFGRGHWYGTLNEQVTTGLKSGKWIVLEIDVEGAAKILKQNPDAISVFIHPGSLEELRRRLEGRGTETTEALERRLEVASHEMQAASIYEHIVTNVTVDQTVADICRLLTQIANRASGDNSECTTN